MARVELMMIAAAPSQHRMSNTGRSCRNRGVNTEKATRIKAYVETSMMIPESMALISAGAKAWASGTHVWRGKRAILMLSPTMKKTKAANTTLFPYNGGKRSERSWMLSEPVTE